MDGDGRGSSAASEQATSGSDPVDDSNPLSRRLVSLYLLTALFSLGYGGIYTLLADIRDRFGFSDAGVGLIAFAGFATGFISQVFLSRFADRGHTARMMRIGIALAAVGMASMIVTGPLWQWIGARLVIGLGTGMVTPSIRRLVIAHDPRHVGRNLGRQTAFDVTGFVLGPVIAAIAAQLFGLRAPFAILAVLYALALLVVGRLVVDTGAAGTTKRAVRDLVRLPAVQSALAAAIAFYLTIGMFESLWSVLLRDLGAATWLIGATLSIFTIPMIVFAPRGGALAQRRGPAVVITISITIAALCTAAYGFAPLWLVIVISGVHAISDGFTMPANQVAVAISSPPDQLATGQGLLGATGLAVAAFAAIAGSWAYDSFARPVVFVGTGVLMMVFVVISRWRWQIGRRGAIDHPTA